MAGTQFLRPSAGVLALMLVASHWQAAHGQRRGASADPFAAPRAGREQAEARSPQATEERNAITPSRGGRSPAEERIAQELQKTTELDVVEMPLKDCVLFLQDRHQIPIVLNAKKLDEASVPQDTAITKSLRGITLRSALNLILDDLDLAFVIKNEVLQITTADAARSLLDVRVYDCRDLLGRQESVASAGARIPPPPTEIAGVFDGGRGRVSDYDQRVQRLLALIMTNVDPRTWQGAAEEDQPRPSGAASEYDGLIVVTQTARTHEKVERLLNMLREAAGMETRMGRVVR
jgi:hypothetical protein